MRQYISFILLLFFIGLIAGGLKAQSSTYSQVYQLLQTNCAGAGCHDGTGGRFNINVSADSFYNEVFNVPCVNTTADSNYNTLVSPGDVQHSFLLRKISHGISDGLALNAGEGSYEPNGLPALANYQIELLRQWILYGYRRSS